MARFLAYGTRDGRVGICDQRDGADTVTNLRELVPDLRELEGDCPVSTVKFNKNATKLYVTVGRGILCLSRNLQEYDWLHLPYNFLRGDPITSICTSYETEKLYTCDNRSISLWNLEDDDIILQQELGGADKRNRTCIDRQSHLLVSGRANGSVEIWNTALPDQLQAPTTSLVVEEDCSICSIAVTRNWICATTDSGYIYELTCTLGALVLRDHVRHFVDSHPVGCFFPQSRRWLRENPNPNGLIPVIVIYDDRVGVYNPHNHAFVYSTRVPHTDSLHSGVCSYTHISNELYCGTTDGRIISYACSPARLDHRRNKRVGDTETVVTALGCWTRYTDLLA